ncbi:uncharacterized protein BYT42DRAFT_612589 [Radiomyces spectabilis]|uniref:uncharacterized protein n=1 Tax=Radiomyces spectabilis TaxID=64574 RepID=UPI0022208478|nr:uncharacterized protein BYT42DRAFT_612589 [Radiomyces spectabilis]KAI8384924.1 hypothetical protein BYT42DRAFT_612589 [Radiomyces spectabilis]
MAHQEERIFYFCDPLPHTRCQILSLPWLKAWQSNTSSHKQRPNHDIPILKSNHSIHPPPWTHTFPPVFVFFHLAFQLSHLVAHTFEYLTVERLCVVYGTWLFWAGWLLGVFVFSERLTIDLTHPTTTLFWFLLLERRSAWGIIVWEFVSQLDQNVPSSSDLGTEKLRFWQLGNYRLLAFRVWCLVGTGSAWGLLYIVLAKWDGFSLLYLLQLSNIVKLLFVSATGGLMMICFWSFWTFQYRGVIWQRELRKGIAVWYSDGIARAGDVI